MKPEKRARFIERAALREAQKAIKRRGGEPLSRDEVFGLRVQTLSLWVRVPLIVLGFTLFIGGLYVTSLGAVGLAVPLLLVGLVLACVGWVGWRRTLSETLEGLGEGLAQGVIEGIFNVLDGL